MALADPKRSQKTGDRGWKPSFVTLANSDVTKEALNCTTWTVLPHYMQQLTVLLTQLYFIRRIILWSDSNKFSPNPDPVGFELLNSARFSSGRIWNGQIRSNPTTDTHQKYNKCADIIISQPDSTIIWEMHTKCFRNKNGVLHLVSTNTIRIVSTMQTVSVTKKRLHPKVNVCECCGFPAATSGNSAVPVLPLRCREFPCRPTPPTLDSRELLDQVRRHDRSELLQNITDWQVHPGNRLTQHRYICRVAQIKWRHFTFLLTWCTIASTNFKDSWHI